MNGAPRSPARVFLTGAAGFIGSHLAEALLDAGAEVTALAHYNALHATGNLARFDHDRRARLRIVFGDVTDTGQMADLASGHDVILHAAALIGIPYSYAAPRSYLRVNTEGTVNLLEAARRHRCRRFVLVSTSEVYGSAVRVPIDEGHPLQAQSPYAASKVAAEAMVEAWRRTFAVPAVILRPFNTYGPRQSARAVIPTILAQAVSGGPVRLGWTAPVRDFLFVGDTAAGIAAAALAPEIGPGPFNLGTGRGVSIAELVAIVGRLVGRTLAVEHDPQRLRPPLGEVDRLIADPAAFAAATGWTARTTLEEGLARTLASLAASPPGETGADYAV